MARPTIARSFARRAVRSMLALALLAALASCDLLNGTDPVPQDIWTSRYVDADGLTWASNREMSRATFDDRVALWSGRGMMIVDVDVKQEGLGLEYALVAHENPDGRDWKLHVDLTSAEYHDLWDRYGADGYRPLDVEGYLDDGQTRFAGIWIENVEGLEWKSVRNATSSEYAGIFDTWRAEGLRPVDIEAYDASSGLRFAAIWWDDVDGLAWSQLRNIDRDRYQQEADDHAADGYLMLDYERYDTSSGARYAAIWERPDRRPAFQIRTNRTQLGFANLWRTYRDMGYRLADFESDEQVTDPYGGIWIENDERFRYPRKGSIDAEVEAYLDAYTVDDTGIETGLSVAVIQNGEVIYRRGFGFADVAAGEVAHAETVYGFASVSKVVGGTLAARLEATNELQDGTTFSLDMDDRTDAYLTSIPSQHTHDVEQLTAHLSCVAHYPGRTTPSISNQTTHYDTALAAAQSFWDVGLVTTTVGGNACTIGARWSYSTPAFTLLGAVLEEATGETLVDLLQNELFDPFGLESFRVSFADGTQASDDERAQRYTTSGAPASHIDTTWKVLGGGIEGNAVDLAEFGWGVLDARIVDATTRDDRLWTPVLDSCTGFGSGLCRNGMAWSLRTLGGRFVAEHGGLQTGARSWLRVYPNDDLVIAILSNESGHSPNVLAGDIADIVLAP